MPRPRARIAYCAARAASASSSWARAAPSGMRRSPSSSVFGRNVPAVASVLIPAAASLTDFKKLAASGSWSCCGADGAADNGERATFAPGWACCGPRTGRMAQPRTYFSVRKWDNYGRNASIRARRRHPIAEADDECISSLSSSASRLPWVTLTRPSKRTRAAIGQPAMLSSGRAWRACSTI